MKIVKTISEVRAAVKAWRAEGLSVGLVPTMGFLHEGHKSLIDRAVKENDRVVVSDFVNPHSSGLQRIWQATPEIWNAMPHFAKTQALRFFLTPNPPKCTQRMRVPSWI